MLAVALEKFAPHVEVHIYEGASQLTEIGAGIGMSQRIWEIMQTLELDADLSKIRGDDFDRRRERLGSSIDPVLILVCRRNDNEVPQV